MTTEQRNAYLGDGVYASFDGYQIWLAANHPDCLVVALEPKVMENLLHYADSVWGKFSPARTHRGRTDSNPTE